MRNSCLLAVSFT
jgi:hypothetical protein